MRDHNLVEYEIFSCLYYVYGICLLNLKLYCLLSVAGIFVPNLYTVTQLMPKMNSVWEL